MMAMGYNKKNFRVHQQWHQKEKGYAIPANKCEKQ